MVSAGILSYGVQINDLDLRTVFRSTVGCGSYELCGIPILSRTCVYCCYLRFLPLTYKSNIFRGIWQYPNGFLSRYF